jgi:hypothetical protein
MDGAKVFSLTSSSVIPLTPAAKLAKRSVALPALDASTASDVIVLCVTATRGHATAPFARSTCNCTVPPAEEKAPVMVQLWSVMDVATATDCVKCMIAAMACTEAPLAARPLPLPGKSMKELVTVMTFTPVSVVNRATLAP